MTIFDILAKAHFIGSRLRGCIWTTLVNTVSGCRANGAMRVYKSFTCQITGKDPRLVMGKNFHAKNNCSLIVEGGHLKIGENFFMNNGSSINCQHSIEIGDNCLCGEGVKLYDHDHAYETRATTPIRESGFKHGAIAIGNNVWLGSNVVILRNTEIGDDVVIGANNLVKGHVPSGMVLKANPNNRGN